jgi:thiamine-monophosphate kinase
MSPRPAGSSLEIDLEVTPLSPAGQAWFGGRVDEQAALETLATGGDDYEIAFTAAAKDEPALRREAERRHLCADLIWAG